MIPLDIIFLGTASLKPTALRNVSSLAIRFNSSRVWLFDCGEGTQRQFDLHKKFVNDSTPKQSSTKIFANLENIDKIFITHLHGDHVFGLPGLMHTLCHSRSSPSPPIDIYGPTGIGRFIEDCYQDSHAEVDVSSNFRIHELKLKGHNSPQSTPKAVSVIYPNNDGYWDVCDTPTAKITAGEIKHTVFTLGYSLKEKPIIGNILIDNIKSLIEDNKVELIKNGYNPPYQILKKLKKGEKIILPKGQILDPNDPNVMTPGYDGRHVVILGDTCNPSNMINLSRNCDVLIHECTLCPNALDKLSISSATVDAISKGHSTAIMAADFAKKIKARTLLMNHFSVRYKQSDIPMIVNMAKRYAGGAEVIAANDFMQYSVKSHVKSL